MEMKTLNVALTLAIALSTIVKSSYIHASGSPNAPILPLSTCPITLPENNERQTEWDLVTKEEFYKPLVRLAHLFGFAYTFGPGKTKLAEGLDFYSPSLGSYIISADGSNNRSCSNTLTWNCVRATILVDNFQYNFDNDSFSPGDVIIRDRTRLPPVVDWVYNYSDTTQQVRTTLTYEKKTKWSKTESSSQSTTVTVGNKFTWPLKIGESSIDVAFEESQSWSSTTGGTESTKISTMALANVPPRSRMLVSIELEKLSVEYPYALNSTLSYDVEFTGLLRAESNYYRDSYPTDWEKTGNALFFHPGWYPPVRYKWTIGRPSDFESDLKKQFDSLNIPNAGFSWWDWPWLAAEYGKILINTIDAVTRPVYGHISGEIYADSVEHGEIQFGRTEPLQINKRWQINNRPKPIRSITKDELAEYGITNLQLKVTPL